MGHSGANKERRLRLTLARQGPAWQGMAGPGSAWPGYLGLGDAITGEARNGWARYGEACPGTAWQGNRGGILHPASLFFYFCRMNALGFDFAAAALIAITVVGCATPYQPQGLTGGFKDFEAQPGVHYVSYRATAFTDLDTTIQYWHRRAAEICPSGYDIQSHKAEEEIRGVNQYGALNRTPKVTGYITCK